MSTSELHPELAAAIEAAFPGRPVEGVTALSGGFSGANLIAFVVDGAPYVAKRHVTAPGDAEQAAREITCMRLASERGVAPRLRHADTRTGVTIMDRIAGAQLRPTPGDTALLERVAATLRRLHEGPPFPQSPGLMEFLRFVEAQCTARGGARLPEELVRTVDELAQLSAPHAHEAPCHRDLNPNNVLVTADQVYFVDWTTAGAGDPFVDLAQLGVFAFPRPEQREALLEAYLGRRASDDERGRARVARVIALGIYAAGFLFAGAIRGLQPPADEEPLPLMEALAALGAAPERTNPGAVAAALLREMRLEADALGAARGPA